MKFPTVVLAAGAVVLLLAVAIGQRMGDRVMQQATQLQVQSVMPTPLASPNGASPLPYGPDWKRSQALSAASDPRFPDPRVPPVPVPTPLPPPPRTATPRPLPTQTYNPNIPIWRQRPLPTAMPSSEPPPEAPPEQPPSSPEAAVSPP